MGAGAALYATPSVFSHRRVQHAALHGLGAGCASHRRCSHAYLSTLDDVGLQCKPSASTALLPASFRC